MLQDSTLPIMRYAYYDIIPSLIKTLPFPFTLPSIPIGIARIFQSRKPCPRCRGGRRRRRDVGPGRGETVLRCAVRARGLLIVVSVVSRCGCGLFDLSIKNSSPS